MNKLNGWLVLDKPLGMSSAQAVGKVKWLLKPQKIGHAGTLDPLASGVLPLALGEATKTVAYAMDKRKTYRFGVAWGQSRSTGDAEGEVTAESAVRPTETALRTALPAFTGEIMQAPPAYSAIKINGKRAYERARAGEVVTPEARPVTIHSIEIEEFSSDSATFLVECGKGTYVRSLAADLARAVGTLGYVSLLRRTRVGKFDEACAISLEKLEKIVHNDASGDAVSALSELLHPVESVLDDIPARDVDSAFAAKLRQGQAVFCSPPLPDHQIVQAVILEKGGGGRLVALCEVSRGMMKPVRVFNGVAGG